MKSKLELKSKWKTRIFEEIVEVSGGSTPSTKNPDFWNGKILWLTPKQVTNLNSVHIENTEKMITKIGLENGPRRINEAGCVLLTSRAPVGKVVINSVPMAVNQGFIVLHCSKQIHNYFLFYWLKNNKSFLEQNSNGTTFLELTKTTLKKLPISFPEDIKEQIKISNILLSLDNLIQNFLKQNFYLEKIIHSIFKSWFVDFEFPDDDGVSYKSNDGKMVYDEKIRKEIPEGWCVDSLYGCANYVNGSAFTMSDFSDDRTGLPIIKIVELKYGVLPETKFTTKDVDPKYKLYTGDILFSWSGSPDSSIDVFIWTGGSAILNQHIFKINFQNKFQKPFIFFLLKYLKTALIEIARNKQTTGLGHITKKDMEKFMIALPSKQILNKFQSLSFSIFNKIQCNDLACTNLIYLRETLLPKLISGKIQVWQLKN